jgi:hypothetical protein
MESSAAVKTDEANPTEEARDDKAVLVNEKRWSAKSSSVEG